MYKLNFDLHETYSWVLVSRKKSAENGDKIKLLLYQLVRYSFRSESIISLLKSQNRNITVILISPS